MFIEDAVKSVDTDFQITKLNSTFNEKSIPLAGNNHLYLSNSLRPDI